MTQVLSAFPQRPLAVKPGRGAARGWVLAVLGVLLFGTFLGVVGAQIVPAIRDDLAIRNEAVPTPQVRVNGGRCRSRLALFQDCEVTLTWRGKNGMATRTMHYMFVEPHMGSWSVVPMMDPARPELASTDLGLERLTNRIVTAIGAALLGLLLVGGCIVAGVKASAKSREAKALSGRMLRPVAVRFTGWGEGPVWCVQDERGAVHEWPVKKSDKPFVLDEAQGLVLALRDPAGGPAFPLDEKLRLVVLSPEERMRVLAARA